MFITEIKKLDSKRYLICIDYENKIALYYSELKKFGIEQESELSEEIYNKIINDILIKRCRERVGYMLGKSDKSVSDVRKKLKEGYYPDIVIENIIEEYKRYGYLDDERYAFNYIKNNIKRKSLKRIKNELIVKGISKEIINIMLKDIENECEAVTDTQFKIIEKEFYKKKYDFIEEDKMAFNKIVASLLRKGFELDDVMMVYNKIKSSK